MSNNKKKYVITSQKVLSDDESDQLERHCRKSLSGSGQRDALMILIAIKTGARANELLNIKVRHFNRSEKTIFLIGLKGSNDREIPIPDFLVREINLYIKTRKLRPEDRLFDITYDRLYQIWDLWRPVKKKFHSIRHAFALVIYKKSRDIKLVQICLGHRSILNTMVYLDFFYTQEQMRKILL